MRTLIPVLILSVIPLSAQVAGEGSAAVTAPAGPQDYVCPMDKDVRSDKPGVCPRCGMKLVLGVQDEVEYPMQLTVTPPTVRAGQDAQLLFHIDDPKGNTVNHYEIVHEKLFHMFIVSQDLQYFVHDHPVLQPDGTFIYHEKFPKPGLYRVMGDYYPTGGTPQLTAQTVIVPGAPGQEVPLVQPKLKPELGVSHGENTDVELTMDPPEPIVGLKTLLFFHFKQSEGMEKYIGAWAHMLIGSDDLVDMIHDHPFIADGGPQMQFNIIFPRAHTYRIWIQFIRKGVINTVSFTVPVQELK
jgi:hypothetical protein